MASSEITQEHEIIVPSSEVLSTISASAHETVTPRFPATRISASPKMSPGVRNTVGPSNTPVVPSTVYVTSAGQNTVEPPTPVDTLSPVGQGVSDNLLIRVYRVSVAAIVVPVLVSITVWFILIGLSLHQEDV